jgi:hypothetical protein
MVVEGRNGSGLSDSAAVMNCWSQMKGHRWARTSLHHIVALPITASTRGMVTSLTTGQSLVRFAGVRWKKYLLTQACADPWSRRLPHQACISPLI